MTDADDPRLIAAVDLIGRTGAQSFAIRYSDDEQPLVWIALAEHVIGAEGRPVEPGTVGSCNVHEVAAALDPLLAVLRLAEQLVDGGTCTHCQRPTGLELDLETMPLDAFVCWYQYDPELATFRRGCEGETR